MAKPIDKAYLEKQLEGFDTNILESKYLQSVKISSEEGNMIVAKSDGIYAQKGSNYIELNKAEYDALSEEEKHNGTLYFIKDWTQPYAMNGKGMVQSELLDNVVNIKKGSIINLKKSIDDFDALIIGANLNGSTGTVSISNKPGGREMFILTSSIEYAEETNVYGHFSMEVTNGADQRKKEGFTFYFHNPTRIYIGATSYDNESDMSITLFSVKGLKFCAATACYSIEEQIIGQWIDGKPLYQKTYINENVSEFDIDIKDVNIIDISGFLKTTTFVFPYNMYIDSNHKALIYYSNADELLTLRCGEYVGDAYTTIRYTKTTD